MTLDDGQAVIGKVSNYGSYFLFAEDHDRMHACSVGLRGTRFEGMLADILTKDDRPYTWYDGSLWVAFYREVERRESLPSCCRAPRWRTSGARWPSSTRPVQQLRRACPRPRSRSSPTPSTCSNCSRARSPPATMDCHPSGSAGCVGTHTSSSWSLNAFGTTTALLLLLLLACVEPDR